MKLGLHVSSFTWPGGDAQLGPTLGTIATTAEQAGFSRLSVMDHVWQISMVGEEDENMLESYTALGFLAGLTSRLELLTLVTGVTYRAPGLLAKQVSTLDVLSGGRALLGIGAGWNEQEASGLGLDFAGVLGRFERLEEAIQICLQMWSADTGPYSGKHYTLASTLNAPQPLSSPRPRILIGGAGERKTLRLVAQYADACNIFGGADAGHKLNVLRAHCERLGRDYDAIEKTAVLSLDLDGEGGVDGLLTRLRALHELGFATVHGSVPNVSAIAPLEKIGASVIPEIANW
ncbi:MAG: class F420-dependent oxidoreductase [Frankiales bacterium]|nr:class F420-dependent oxidoreductase [Frankiales bacterium]